MKVAATFAGKVGLVTGGSSGIGKACALVFARQGAKVVIADVNPEKGEETIRTIKEGNGEATFIKTDVSKATEVQALIKKIIYTYGALNCAVNNAGIQGISTSTVACTEENWDRVININLKGVWLCMKYEIPHMREQGGGAIVNMSSVAGLMASCLPRFPAYTASKHAVIGLTKIAALEYAKAGIRINALCPGCIDTPMLESNVQQHFDKDWVTNRVPSGRLGSPTEVAEAAVWLCSEAASFVTGNVMVVDGGSIL